MKKAESAEEIAKFSQSVSCQQGIALRCSFSLGMFIPELESSVRNSDPAAYRMWHWECGAAGQLLYLEAEARGLKATGMGCFTDDSTLLHLGKVHETGASLYHFAIGVPIQGDERYKAYNYESSFGEMAVDEMDAVDRASALAKQKKQGIKSK